MGRLQSHKVISNKLGKRVIINKIVLASAIAICAILIYLFIKQTSFGISYNAKTLICLCVLVIGWLGWFFVLLTIIKKKHIRIIIFLTVSIFLISCTIIIGIFILQSDMEISLNFL